MVSGSRYFGTKMSNSFYVILPSNTNVEGNKSNTFRVRLARKLQFNSDWYVGLAVMVYPHSWPSLGTMEQQFMQVVWRTGQKVRVTVPASNITNPSELSKHLYKQLGEGSELLAQQVRTTQLSLMHANNAARKAAVNAYIEQKQENGETIAEEDFLRSLITQINTLVVDLQGLAEGLVHEEQQIEAEIPERGHVGGDEDAYQQRLNEYFRKLSEYEKRQFQDLYSEKLNEEIAKMTEEERTILNATMDWGLEAWVHAYRKARFAVRFNFDTNSNRFSLLVDTRYIRSVELSDQLAYILGFDKTSFTEAENVARFMPDMAGGVSSFHVYSPGLIEPMMIGDVTAPILRIVTIRGRPDEVIEEQFLSIQYHKLLVKEISEILIEIRTTGGTLMPFQYGTCTLTLHFRKAAYF